MEIGWSELLVIGVVALVIIGPKDLPEMFRTLGRFTAKLRSMARDFSRAMEDAARETGVKDVADDLRKVASPKSMGLEAVKSAADKFEKWDPLKATRPGATAPPAAAAAAAAPAAVAETAAPAPVTVADLPPAAPAAPMGPATAALAEKVTLRKGIAAEAAEKLRATRVAESGAAGPASAAEPAPAEPAAAPKRGRTRSAAPKAEAAAEPAAKPARKPAARKAAAKDPE